MQKLNLANKITCFRIFLLIPIILLLLIPSWENDWLKSVNYDFTNINSICFFIAGILFLLASLSDFIDGYVARKYNMVTTLGKFLDPIADKIIVNSVFIIFAFYHLVPVWIVVLMILRDVIVNALRMLLAKNNKVLAADNLGKLKTVFQFIGILILFFIFPINHYINSWDNFMPLTNDWWLWVLNIPIIISLFFSYWSGYNYIKGGYAAFKNK